MLPSITVNYLEFVPQILSAEKQGKKNHPKNQKLIAWKI
jgi:hypothetical protein